MHKIRFLQSEQWNTGGVSDLFWQVIINGIVAGSGHSLIAIGFALIYRTMGFFHFAHGVVYATGAYLAYTSVNSLGINPIASFFLR